MRPLYWITLALLLSASTLGFCQSEDWVPLSPQDQQIKEVPGNPGASIVEFTGKPFDKTIFKGRGFKLAAKTFTMPDVTVGSIIEYKYRLENYWSDTWVLQHDLFTVKEFVSFEPGHFGQGLSWVGRNTQDHQPVKKSGRWEMQWDNIPAFEVETNMPPERNYKPTFQFYYLGYQVTGS